MAGTYTQLFVHVVFAVDGRQNLIPRHHKDELHKYIAGIMRNTKHKLLAINCMPDHTHAFIAYNPDISVSSLVRDLKSNASRFINEKGWVSGTFNWQTGYGAFTYSRSQMSTVIRYIENQEVHHRKTTFQEEYQEMLQKFDVKYDKRYIFKTDYPQ